MTPPVVYVYFIWSYFSLQCRISHPLTKSITLDLPLSNRNWNKFYSDNFLQEGTNAFCASQRTCTWLSNRDKIHWYSRLRQLRFNVLLSGSWQFNYKWSWNWTFTLIVGSLFLVYCITNVVLKFFNYVTVRLK